MINESDKQKEGTVVENQDLVQQTKADALELFTLKKACQLQKQDMAAVENSVKNLQDEMYHNR